MLAAKATVLTAVVVAAGTVSVLASLLAGQRAAAGNRFTAKHGFLPTTLPSLDDQHQRQTTHRANVTCYGSAASGHVCPLDDPAEARQEAKAAIPLVGRASLQCRRQAREPARQQAWEAICAN